MEKQVLYFDQIIARIRQKQRSPETATCENTRKSDGLLYNGLKNSQNTYN